MEREKGISSRVSDLNKVSNYGMEGLQGQILKWEIVELLLKASIATPGCSSADFLGKICCLLGLSL
jgi:hypothetical protein